MCFIGLMRSGIESQRRHPAGRDEGAVKEGVRIDPGIAERLRAMGYLR